MNLETSLAITLLSVGAFTFLIVTKLIEQIPRQLHISWQRNIEEFRAQAEAPTDFKIGLSFKIIATLVTCLIVTEVQVKSGINTESLGFSLLFITMTTLVGINLKYLLLPDILVLPLIWIGLLLHAYLGHNTNSYVYG